MASLNPTERTNSEAFGPLSAAPTHIRLVLNENEYDIPFALFNAYEGSLFHTMWIGDKSDNIIALNNIKDRVIDKETGEEHTVLISKELCDLMYTKMLQWGVFDHLSEYTNKYLMMGKTPLLLEHQYMHVLKINKVFDNIRAAIDMSIMGAGKTHVAAMIARMRGLKLIVIAPNKISAGKWEDVARRYHVPCNVYTYGLLSTSKNNDNKDRVVPSIPLLTYREKKANGGTYIKEYATLEFIREVEKGVLLVFDECQNLKNVESKRTKRAILLTRYIYASSRSRTLLVSATIFDKVASAETMITLLGLHGSPDDFDQVFIDNCRSIKESFDESQPEEPKEGSLDDLDDGFEEITRDDDPEYEVDPEYRDNFDFSDTDSFFGDMNLGAVSVTGDNSDTRVITDGSDAHDYDYERRYQHQDQQDSIPEQDIPDGADPAEFEKILRRARASREALIDCLPLGYYIRDTTCDIVDGVMTSCSSREYHYWYNYVHVISKYIAFSMPFSTSHIPHRISNAIIDLDEADSEVLKETFAKFEQLCEIMESRAKNSMRGQQNLQLTGMIHRELEETKIKGMCRLATKYLKGSPRGKVILCFNYVKNIVDAEKFMKEEMGLESRLIYGKISQGDRLKAIHDYQYGDLRVLIINPATCGVAIDLDALNEGEERLMFFSPSWFCLRTQQAMGRIMRATTRGKAGVIHVYSEQIKMEQKLINRIAQKSDVLIRTFGETKHNVRVSDGFGVVSLDNISSFFDGVK